MTVDRSDLLAMVSTIVSRWAHAAPVVIAFLKGVELKNIEANKALCLVANFWFKRARKGCQCDDDLATAYPQKRKPMGFQMMDPIQRIIALYKADDVTLCIMPQKLNRPLFDPTSILSTARLDKRHVNNEQTCMQLSLERADSPNLSKPRHPPGVVFSLYRMPNTHRSMES